MFVRSRVHLRWTHATRYGVSKTSLTSRTLRSAVGILLLGPCLLASIACAPAARVHVVPLQEDQIKLDGDVMAEYVLPRGYHWTNDVGELCLALSHGPGPREHTGNAPVFELSLLLDGTPAGMGRNYLVDTRTARGIAFRDSRWARYASLRGIVAVQNDERDLNILHGRFRIWAIEQEYRWFWWDHNRQDVLLVGEFTTLHEPIRGEQLWRRTAVEGLERPPPSGRPVPVTGPPLSNEPDGD